LNFEFGKRSNIRGSIVPKDFMRSFGYKIKRVQIDNEHEFYKDLDDYLEQEDNALLELFKRPKEQCLHREVQQNTKRTLS
jgi:hypothetical protein